MSAKLPFLSACFWQIPGAHERRRSTRCSASQSSEAGGRITPLAGCRKALPWNTDGSASPVRGSLQCRLSISYHIGTSRLLESPIFNRQLRHLSDLLELLQVLRLVLRKPSDNGSICQKLGKIASDDNEMKNVRPVRVLHDFYLHLQRRKLPLHARHGVNGDVITSLHFPIPGQLVRLRSGQHSIGKHHGVILAESFATPASWSRTGQEARWGQMS